MPGNVGNAAPATVFPAMTFRSLSKSIDWLTNVTEYPDGSTQRLSVPGGSPAKARTRFSFRARLGPGKRVADGAITTGTPNLTSASNPWTAADEGKWISVAGAGIGGLPMVSTILTYVSAGAVTLRANAGTTASAVEVIWGSGGPTAMGTLAAFYVACKGKHAPFYFYYGYETSPLFTTGPTGAETAGRYTVRFDCDWKQEWALARGEVDLQLVEVT